MVGSSTSRSSRSPGRGRPRSGRAGSRSTHSTSAWAPSPPGPKMTVGMPAAEKIGAVRPERDADHGHVAAQCLAGGRHDRPSRASTSNGSRTSVVCSSAARSWPASADRIQHRRQLGLDALGRLARQRPALQLQPAAVRVGRELAAAVDDRGVDRSRAEQRVRRRAAASSADSLLEADQHVAHAGDRVDAVLRARAVRRAAGTTIRCQVKPLCATATLISRAGRLGHDGGVGRDRLRPPPGRRPMRTPRRRPRPPPRRRPARARPRSRAATMIAARPAFMS